MDAVGAGFNIIFFIIVLYLISRVANFMIHTKDKLNEIENKLDEIKTYIDKKE